MRLGRYYSSRSAGMESTRAGMAAAAAMVASTIGTTANDRERHRAATMQAQVTVRLPDDLRRALKAASRRMQRKSSEIVRLALREFLVASSGSRVRPADRVQSLIGSLESGIPDLAERHRAHVIESLRRGR